VTDTRRPNEKLDNAKRIYGAEKFKELISL